MYESCHTHVWVMSHIGMSYESCHTHVWIMSHIWRSHVRLGRVQGVCSKCNSELMFWDIQWHSRSLCDAHGNTLQHTATHCNTLQHTAIHCNTLQHTATHFQIFSGTADHCATHRLLLCTALMLRTPLSFLQPRTTYTCDILIYIWHSTLLRII